MIEKLIFNMLAFSLLVIMVIKMIRKNDNAYFFILGGQILGIIVNFLELVSDVFVGNGFKIITYLLSVVVPIAILILESKDIYFSEFVYILLSKIAYSANNYRMCKKLLDRLVKVNPKSYYGHKMLATLYEKEGGLRKAIDEYVALVDLKPKDYESYYKIGVLLDELDKKDEAVTILNNLLKKKPDFYKASELLGIILCDQEKFKQAATVYQDALRYNPLSYELYYNLAIVHTRLNDFGSAKECFQMAANINHELYNAYYSLGQIYLLYHDIDAAEEAFTKSIYGKETECKSYYQLAKLYLTKGDKEKAIIFINNAIRLDRSYVNNVRKESIFEPIKYHVLDEAESIEMTLEEEKVEGHNEEKAVSKEEEIEEYLNETLDLVKSLNETEVKEEKTEVSEKQPEIDMNNTAWYRQKE